MSKLMQHIEAAIASLDELPPGASAEVHEHLAHAWEVVEILQHELEGETE